MPGISLSFPPFLFLLLCLCLFPLSPSLSLTHTYKHSYVCRSLRFSRTHKDNLHTPVWQILNQPPLLAVYNMDYNSP